MLSSFLFFGVYLANCGGVSTMKPLAYEWDDDKSSIIWVESDEAHINHKMR